jgi:hypothetical protein
MGFGLENNSAERCDDHWNCLIRGVLILGFISLSSPLIITVSNGLALQNSAGLAVTGDWLEYDPNIAEMIAAINESNLNTTTCDLQSFSTRASGKEGNAEAATYLYQRLDDIPGLEVAFQGGDLKNIIATLPGTDTTSDAVIIVGAHYDSVSSDPAYAPGATDNGCGVAIVLELARVMSRHSFDCTVQFAFWNAEEIGRRGSRSYVQTAAEREATIPLYLNYDSACFDPDNRYVLNMLYNAQAETFAELMMHNNRMYGFNFTLIKQANIYASDHVSFWSFGYPAIMTHAPRPRWPAHTTEDTIDKVSFSYAKRNAQLGLSVLATVAEMHGAAGYQQPKQPTLGRLVWPSSRPVNHLDS